jgi:hypothetical protein
MVLNMFILGFEAIPPDVAENAGPTSEGK